jgi:aryl-alcohol dehydrogenase-like predicted oxidoreductase
LLYIKADKGNRSTRMPRIAVHDYPGGVVLQLKGRVAVPWLNELETLWLKTVARQMNEWVIMETIEIGTSGITASRMGLSTEAIGGWAWGANTGDLERAMSTIPSAIERGITFVHTAPVYGFGLSERIVGVMLSGGLRERVVIATQTGLEWRDGKVRRNSTPAHVRKEVEESLRRLRTDRIDLYIVQWPDPLTPIVETAKTLARLLKEGKIRAIGVANYSVEQMDEFQQAAPIHAVQVPYNLFEREAESSVVPYARRHNIAVLCYDILCRRLLTRTITATTQFQENDLRQSDPKFHEPRLSQYVSAAAALDRFARACYGWPLTALAVRWVLDQGNTIALLNARRLDLDLLTSTVGPCLDDMATRQIEKIIRHTVKDPVGPRFMPPPSRSELPLVA